MMIGKKKYGGKTVVYFDEARPEEIRELVAMGSLQEPDPVREEDSVKWLNDLIEVRRGVEVVILDLKLLSFFIFIYTLKHFFFEMNK